MSINNGAETLLGQGACWLQGCHASRAQRKALKQVGQHMQQAAGNSVPHRNATCSQQCQQLLLHVVLQPLSSFEPGKAGTIS